MKKITTILFDLDGTLIRMDQDKFIEHYFRSILAKLASLGYEVSLMKTALEASVRATIRNDGAIINEERFWATFEEHAPSVREAVKDALDEYYAVDFKEVIRATCDGFPEAKGIVELAKKCGKRCVLATNPLFPMIATVNRMALSNLIPDDFEYVTAYENSSACKPNPAYFAELLSKLGIPREECVMIGNDTRDDFSAHALGIPVFVLTECLINTSGVDLSKYPHGGFSDLAEYIKSL